MIYYYYFKSIIPRRIQIFFRRKIVEWKQKKCNDIWPIDEKAGEKPEGWRGWPDGKQFALVLTHDVETERGLDKCHELMNLEKELGFRSSFNFVAEDYHVPPELRYELINNGFEVGLHGLNHDGKLYRNKKTFLKQAIRINHYLKEWGAVGFRSPSMYRNLDWIKNLNIEYDSSTFDTDPFEPQPEGVCTIFPFFVQGNSTGKRYIELPYTLPQDHTIFIILRKKDIDIWKKKLDWIAEKGGMALLITHPDYMNFNGKKLCYEEYPSRYYEEFLGYIKSRYKGQYCNMLAKEVAFFVSNFANKQNNNMIQR